MLAVVALVTNLSMCPKDLSQRLCEKARLTRGIKRIALEDHSVCAKSIVRSGPVTEILTLGAARQLIMTHVAGCFTDAAVKRDAHLFFRRKTAQDSDILLVCF